MSKPPEHPSTSSPGEDVKGSTDNGADRPGITDARKSIPVGQPSADQVTLVSSNPGEPGRHVTGGVSAAARPGSKTSQSSHNARSGQKDRIERVDDYTPALPGMKRTFSGRLGKRVKALVRSDFAYGVVRGMDLTFHFAFTAMIFFLLVSSVFFWRLAQGPVSLGGLIGTIETSVNDRLGDATDIRVTIGTADFTWANIDDAPRIRLHDVEIWGTRDRRLAAVPEVAAQLSVSRLLRGGSPLKAIEIDQPVLRLVRRPNGSLGFRTDLGVSDDDAEISELPDESSAFMVLQDGSELIARVQQLIGQNAIAIILRNGIFDFDNWKTGASFDLSSINARLEVQNSILWMSVATAFDPGVNPLPRFAPVGENPLPPPPPAAASVRAYTRADAPGIVNLSVLLDGVSPDHIAYALSAFANKLPERAPDQIELEADAPQALADTSVSGAGGEEATPSDPLSEVLWVMLDANDRVDATVTGSLDISIDAASLSQSLERGVSMDTDAAKALLDMRFAIGIQNLALREFAFLEGLPFAVPRLNAEGSVGGNLEYAVIDRLEIDPGNGGRVWGTLQATGILDHPALSIEGHFENLGGRTLVSLWPKLVAEDARMWIDENLIDGVIPEATLKVDLVGDTWSEIDLASLSGNAELDRVSLWYRKPLPPLEDLRGELFFSTQEIWGTVNQGHVRGLDDLHIKAGSFRFTGIDVEDQDAVIKADVAGRLSSVLSLLDKEPFGYASEVGLDPKAASGNVTGTLKFDFPMLADLEFDQISLAATANLTNVNLPGMAEGFDLSDGNLSLSLTEKGMDVSGKALLAGIPSDIVWRENFEGGDYASRYRIKGSLDEAARRNLGLDINAGDAFKLAGAAAIDATITKQHDKKTVYDATLNLNGLSIDIPPLGWHKTSGDSGTLTVKGYTRAGSSQFDIALSALPGARVSLSAGLSSGKTTTLTRLDIKEISIGDSQIIGSVTRAQNGGYSVQVASGFLDLRYLPAWMNSDKPASGSPSASKKVGSGATSLPTFQLAGQLATVRLDDTVFIDGLKTNVRSQSGSIQSAEIQGVLRGAGPLSAVLGPSSESPGARSFKMTAPDGGALLKALDIYPAIAGGPLDINASLFPDGRMSGLVKMTDFRVKDAPLLAKIISIAGLTGILDAFRGPGLGFSKLRIPFEYNDPILQIDDASMHGSSVGLTIRGTLNTGSEVLDMEGTLVPAYAINNLIGNIPVIGNLIIGGEGEGLIAANYRLTGTLGDSNVTVNPLSVLTPGFLRNIFGLFSSD